MSENSAISRLREIKMPDLHLNLKGEYFNQIKSGEKLCEYREITPYWTKRLQGRFYDNIYIKRGYPKKDDKDNIIIRPWKGYLKRRIQHEHFGDDSVNVYAIIVN